MKLGVLLEQGGSLGSMKKAGQENRLRYYFERYRRAFSDVVFFSYDDEAEIPAGGVRIVARKGTLSPTLYSFRLPWAQRDEIRSCDVLRVLQISAAIPAAISKSLYRVPYAVTFGYDPRVQRGHRLSRTNIWAARRTADVIFCSTPRLRDRMASDHPRGRLELLPNGVDLELFSRRTPRAPSPGPRRILSVGRLSSEKNYEMLIDAASGLGNVEIHLAGDGREREALVGKARRAGVSLILHGSVPQPELPALYAVADVFVLASRSEGLPKALLEAMASGTPCVGTNVAGIQDVLENERTGLLVDETSDSLARGIAAILGSRELSESLTRAAREEVERTYDLRAILSREIEVLESLVRA